MKNSKTAILFFILVVVLGSQASIIPDMVKEGHHYNPPIIHQGFQDSSDCCLSYAPQIRCSRFIDYFSTSGECIMPAIIFINKKGKQVCANPHDPRVQSCLRTLNQVPRSGNRLIA